MFPERWQHIQEIFQKALELAPAERAAYVERACAGDSELRREVLALLRQNESAGDFPNDSASNSQQNRMSVVAEPVSGFGDPFIGQRMGAYMIEREIGRGGMGAVYLATRADNAFQRRVAVKVIKRGMDTDHILRRFRHERQILAALEHPNITRLLDGGATPGGQPYFVMEYIEGQPLYEYCDAHRLGVRERLRLFCQICDAVEYAHRNLVIHRDIKPSNVLVSAAGVPKLFDFGIAKLLNPELAPDTSPQTATAMRLMTVEYASPEQVQGLLVTFLSDVYSLGVLLYELLTGHRPYRFQSRVLHEMARVIVEEEPELPSATVERAENLLSIAHVDKEAPTIGHLCELRGDSPLGLSRTLSGSLDAVTMKALRKDPAQRYQSAAALRDDIMRYLDGRPVSAPLYVLPSSKPARAADKNKAEELSIAVLPFKLMGARRPDDTSDEYLSVGLTDALITRLSNVRRLVVRPTSSVLRYAETGDPLHAGQQLAVNYIVDGSIRRAGDKLRVTVQLLSVNEGAARWAGKFDEDYTDVLRLEDLISEQVAGALVPQLTREEQQQLAKRGTDRAEAYESYLRGRHHFHSLTEEGFAKALQHYQRAIALDPNYALAYVGIADYYIFLGIYGVLPFDESSAAAKEAAQKAVRLDDKLAEAHATLGFAIVSHDFDWPTSEQHHRRAIELNPNSTIAHNWYAFNLLQQARFDEALHEINRALELDPVTPLVLMSLAWCYYHSRRFDEALAVYRKVIEAEPNFPYGRTLYSWALTRAGRHREAIEQAQKAVELAGQGQLYLSGLGAALAGAGRVEEAREILRRLREMSRTNYVSPYFLAQIYCYLDDKEQALAYLAEAVRIKDAWATWLAVDPQLDSLRSEARFNELVRRTNNPAAQGRVIPVPKTKPDGGEKLIAVLPFRMLGAASEDDTAHSFLGVGLTDALITRLSNVHRLIVRPTSSVLRFSEGPTDPFVAARELGVQFVLDGHMRRAGDRLRLSVQLLDVKERANVWAAAFDEKSADVFTLEDVISFKVAEALIPHLSGDEREQLNKRSTENAEAYEAYLRGRYYWYALSEEGFAKAFIHYQRAIVLDPEYAAAYAAVAEYHGWLAIFGVMPPAECLAAAREAAQRAVEMDETLAEAHTALGFALLAQETQWQSATLHYRRALELNPNYAMAYVWYAGQLAMEGRFDESDREMQRACELDPLNPFNSYLRMWYLYQARRYQESVRRGRELLQNEPLYGPAYFALCWALRRMGDYEAAIEAGRKAVEVAGDSPQNVAALGAAYAEAGRTVEARQVLAQLDQLARHRFVTPYHRALLHLHLNEREAALALLSESVDVEEPWIAWLGVEPQLDNLRGDPAFNELLRRTGNPAAARSATPASKERSPAQSTTRPISHTNVASDTSLTSARQTTDEEAHQFYMAGRYFATKRTAEGLRLGIERLERAVERDPNFALAYAEMADCYALLNWYVEPPPANAWAQAKEAALRAVAADDSLAEAHASLGFVHLHYDRDFAAAESEFRRAIQQKPGSAVARRWHAFSLSAMGRHEDAIAEIERAREVSPHSPVIATAVANVLFFARQFDAAIEQCRRALELDPGNISAHILLRWSLEKKGMHDEALAVYEQERAFAGDTPTTRAKRVHVLASAGRHDEAKRILEDLLARRDEQWVSPYEVAVIYALLGERQNAIHWLEEAKREHAVGFTFVLVDPRLDALRSDPRFIELLRQTAEIPSGLLNR